MTIISIDFDRLQANHPTRSEFRKQVPDWPTKWHPCCAKLSLALNKSGDPVTKYDYPDPVTGKSRAWKSKTGQNYLMAVHDARAYLTNTYDYEPERFGSRAEFIAGTQERKGIIGFGLFHIDVWSYGDINHPEEFNIPVLWNKTNWGGEKLMFWEVCIPAREHVLMAEYYK